MNEILRFPQEIQKEIEDQISVESWKNKPVKPLESPVMALPHTAIYKMHRYYARRPYNVFDEIIQRYTNPGDLILDPFCGGGVTVVEAMKLRRRVIGVDLNPLATWITQVEVESVDLNELDQAFTIWLEAVQKQINPLFEATCGACGKIGSAEWFEWSNVVRCPSCGKSNILGKCQKIRGGHYLCTNKRCQSLIEADKCERQPDEMLTALVNCPHCGERNIRDINADDADRVKQIKSNFNRIVKQEKLSIPDDDFPDMNSVRENNLFGKGFLKFRDYFTTRHLLAIARMKSSLRELKSDKRTINSLYNIFSATLRFTNKMVIRSEAWRGDNPLEWPGHIYWPPYTYLEANPVKPLLKRYKAQVAGKLEQKEKIGDFCRFPKIYRPWEDMQSSATCWIINQSSHDLPIPDKSVDAVITDPPFGGNVQYAELSDFYLVWLKDFLKLPDGAGKEQEAIETRHQGFDGAKDRDFYENMLFKIFKECRRVIKPDGWMALTFHNRDIGVWMSMNRAAIRAGFRLPPASESLNRGMIYQPPIQNYTQTIHQKRTGSMLGDFVLSFRPVDEPVYLGPVLQELPTEEEKGIYAKADEIIRFHGGADETTLMTGLLPYLQEKGLLARLARFDLRSLLSGGQFVFRKDQKKWYAADMIEPSGGIKPIDVIQAEHLVQELIFEYLLEHKHASNDDLLRLVYTALVNAHRPQIDAIEKVLGKYCKRINVKGQKREQYQWTTGVPSPLKVQQEKQKQTDLMMGESVSPTHNGIIFTIAQEAITKGYFAHVGATEQRKNGSLDHVSLKLTYHELGVPKKAFDIIRQIDLLLLKEYSVIAAIEVVTSLSTLNKAVNDRFRNLLSVIPNLNFRLYIVVNDEDFMAARAEIHSPVNQREGLADRIRLLKVSEVTEGKITTYWPFQE
jgi:SAM-dependent methyltransferase